VSTCWGSASSSTPSSWWRGRGWRACLVLGAGYAQINREFYKVLDSTTVQEWFLHSGSADLARSWWVLALFLAMALLGINTVLCALNRIVTLCRNGSGVAPGRRFLLFVPSFVHILFVLTLSGHLLTFTLGAHQRIPISADTTISLPSGARLRVDAIEMKEYPAGIRLRGRVQGASVVLLDLSAGMRRELHFMRPIMIGSEYLHLDFALDRTGPMQIVLLVTHDPGLPVIVTGLVLLIALMLAYYLARLRMGPLVP
jgi:hypothetical protein